MKPQRIQLSRRKGWRMPPNTVRVSRPGPFGNPWSVRDAMRLFDITEGAARAKVVEWFRDWITHPTSDDPCDSTGLGGHLAEHQRILEAIPTLRGKNLACWCPLVDRYGCKGACHADLLLELANGPVCEPAHPAKDGGGD